MNYLNMNYLNWIHEISQSALAAAVLILGLVILLELRSIARLRRTVDIQLQRVFEQLDLLRLESQHAQPLEPAQSLRTLSPMPTLPAVRTAATASPVPADKQADELSARQGLGAGEARLLASLAAARARLARPVGRGS
ncbi:MAG: hypothetical protein ABSH23_03905 [Steroidobacteraceae bacterium]